MNLNLTMNSVFVLDGILLMFIVLVQIGIWLTARNLFRTVSIVTALTFILVLGLTFPRKVALARAEIMHFGVVQSGGMTGDREHWIQFYRNWELTQLDGRIKFVRFCQDDPFYPGVIIDDLEYQPRLECWYWKHFNLRRTNDGKLILASIR